MRGIILGIVTLGLLACSDPNAHRPTTPTTSTTTTTSSDSVVGGPGYSGTTEYGGTYGPTGTPYRPNEYPGSPANNREKEQRPADVRTDSNSR